MLVVQVVHWAVLAGFGAPDGLDLPLVGSIRHLLLKPTIKLPRHYGPHTKPRAPIHVRTMLTLDVTTVLCVCVMTGRLKTEPPSLSPRPTRQMRQTRRKRQTRQQELPLLQACLVEPECFNNAYISCNYALRVFVMAGRLKMEPPSLSPRRTRQIRRTRQTR